MFGFNFILYNLMLVLLGAGILFTALFVYGFLKNSSHMLADWAFVAAAVILSVGLLWCLGWVATLGIEYLL